MRERGLEASSSSSGVDGLFPRLQIDSLEERDRPSQIAEPIPPRDRPLGRFGPANSRRAFMQQRDLIDMLREVYQDQEPSNRREFEMQPQDNEDDMSITIQNFDFDAPNNR